MASFDEAISPGQVGKINGTLKTGSYRGLVTKTIAVTTNDPAQNATTLTLKVRIVGSVEIVPIPSINVSAGGPDSRPGRVLVRQDATETGTLKLANLTVSPKWLQATAKVITAEGGDRVEGLPQPKVGDVIIEVAPKDEPAEYGQSQGTVMFDTGLPREPKVTIPVYAYYRGPITLGAQEIILQPGVDATVLVGLRSDVDADKVTATAEPTTFKATLERANANALRLRIAVDESKGPAPSMGSVTVHAGATSATVQVRVLR